MFQVLVVGATAVLLGAGGWGLALLRQEFDPAWFLPPDSYLSEYLTASRRFYPGDGEPATVFLSGVNHSANLGAIAALVDQIERQDVVQEVDAWYPLFQTYANSHFNTSE